MEKTLWRGDLFSFQHATARLINHTVAQFTVVVNLFPELGDDQIRDHVRTDRFPGLLQYLSRAVHDFLGDPDEFAIFLDLLRVPCLGVMRWISCIRRRAARVRLRNPSARAAPPSGGGPSG